MWTEQLWTRLHRWRWLVWLVVLIPAGALAAMLATWPAPPAPCPASEPRLVLPRTEAIPANDWLALADPDAKPVQRRDVAEFYRFAGAIVIQGADGVPRRKAFLHDLRRERQDIVAEGERLHGELEVVEIQSDLLTVRFDGLTQHLEMGLASGEAVVDGGATNAPSGRGLRYWERPAIDRSRFGKRIEERRWVLKRESLIGYYEEMVRQPEALLRLYDTFQPDRNDERKVAGYSIEPRGRQPFLKDMGLREGDVVRAVNSMRMTSQRRAEWFIAEFVRGNLDAIVLDVERDGETVPFIYHVR